MKILSKLFKRLGYVFLTILGTLVLIYFGFSIKWANETSDIEALLGDVAPKLLIDGHNHRDLNKNGILDVYENPNESIHDRVENLISQMSIEEKTESISKGIEAQKKSLVLLKNENNFLPLQKQTKVYLHGFDSNPSIELEGTSLENAEVIIAKVKTPNEGVKSEYIMEKILGGGVLDFSDELLAELIPLFSSKPTILVTNFQRPAVLTKIEGLSKAIIADFDVDEKIILELIQGNFSPTGKLPLELPSSMKAVEDQLEDLPFDSKNPLYKFGHGLSYRNKKD